MRHIWTPWRMSYILKADEGGCVFCRRQNNDDDRQSFVLERGPTIFTILNIYPYTAGHLMVCPYRHVGRWSELTDGERGELLLATQRASDALNQVYEPDSLHIGSNIGRPAGAGVLGHLHLHLVPFRGLDGLEDPDRPGLEDLPEPLTTTYERVRAVLTGPES